VLKQVLLFFLGPAAALQFGAAAAMLRGSQVCSALRGLCPLGLAYGHPLRSAGPWLAALAGGFAAFLDQKGIK